MFQSGPLGVGLAEIDADPQSPAPGDMAPALDHLGLDEGPLPRGLPPLVHRAEVLGLPPYRAVKNGAKAA